MGVFWISRTICQAAWDEWEITVTPPLGHPGTALCNFSNKGEADRPWYHLYPKKKKKVQILGERMCCPRSSSLFSWISSHFHFCYESDYTHIYEIPICLGQKWNEDSITKKQWGDALFFYTRYLFHTAPSSSSCLNFSLLSNWACFEDC